MTMRETAIAKLYEAQTLMQQANQLLAEANYELQRAGIDQFARDLREQRDALAACNRNAWGVCRRAEALPEPAPEAGVCPKCGGWTNKCLCDL